MNDKKYILHTGDCRDVMKTMDADSIDSVVSDPPYGLSFMGKGWDHGVPSVEFWSEALRVAKPGAYLLAFGGTRTFHRLTVAIEDAGWEIRDCVMWVYGSGFPKSHNVGKAIDKLDAVDNQWARRYRFTAWVRSQGVTSMQIDRATQTNMGWHYTTEASQPAIMTREHLEACRHLFGDVPGWVEREADIRSVESKTFAEREVVGVRRQRANNQENSHAPMNASTGEVEQITAPATAAAKQWDGWGTALKPAWEPIIVARKPLIGTVAENVLTHGTGAINVDGCRVGTTDQLQTLDGSFSFSGSGGANEIGKRSVRRDAGLGRFPANLIHDNSDQVVGLFPNTKSGKVGIRTSDGFNANAYGKGMGIKKGQDNGEYGDSGSAARFFYGAKANKRDRDEGNKHPTVKSTELMRYLCRLVTPPNGIILDPFMGSGSTGKAAMLEGFRFTGIDITPEYVTIATARIEAALKEKAHQSATLDSLL